jgi:hypothetical protein
VGLQRTAGQRLRKIPQKKYVPPVIILFVETLHKSLDSFASRHANTVFYRAVNPGKADDILAQGKITDEHLELPAHFTTSLTHAQHYLPHHPVVQFILKPAAKILDMRFHSKSETGQWDATLPDEEDLKHPLGRAGLSDEGLIDGLFHEFEDILELHNPDMLTPVKVHPPIYTGE